MPTAQVNNKRNNRPRDVRVLLERNSIILAQRNDRQKKKNIPLHACSVPRPADTEEKNAFSISILLTRIENITKE